MDISFQIDNDTFEVPAVLTADTFQSAMAWDIEDVKNHKPFVSAMTGCPVHKLSLLDNVTFEIVLASCVMKLPQERDVMIRQHGVFTLKDFDKFSFGDFIDIDVFIADGLTNHIVDLISKLYSMPQDIAAAVDIDRVWTTIVRLAKWREFVYKEHDEFFELSSASPSDDTERTINNLQLMWYEAVLALADGQFLNIQHVVERPYKEALNFLTWKKNEVAKQKLEQVKRKYDLQKSTR